MTASWAVSEFEWDHFNSRHLWERHRISPEEAEEVFDGPVRVRRGGTRHGVIYYEALGPTQSGRYLFVVFQIKQERVIRVGSARPMTRTERKWYGKA